MDSNQFSLNVAYDKGFETLMTPDYGVRIFRNDVLVANTVQVAGGMFRLKTPHNANALAYAAAQAAETE